MVQIGPDLNQRQHLKEDPRPDQLVNKSRKVVHLPAGQPWTNEIDWMHVHVSLAPSWVMSESDRPTQARCSLTVWTHRPVAGSVRNTFLFRNLNCLIRSRTLQFIILSVSRLISLNSKNGSARTPPHILCRAIFVVCTGHSLKSICVSNTNGFLGNLN